MVTKHPGVPYLTSNFDAPRYQNPPKAEVRAPPQLLIETSSPVSTKSTAWTPMDGFRMSPFLLLHGRVSDNPFIYPPLTILNTSTGLLYDCEWITYRGILGQSAPIIPNKSITHTSQNGDSYSFKCGFCKKGTLVRPTAIPQCGHLFCYRYVPISRPSLCPPLPEADNSCIQLHRLVSLPTARVSCL